MDPIVLDVIACLIILSFIWVAWCFIELIGKIMDWVKEARYLKMKKAQEYEKAVDELWNEFIETLGGKNG